MTDSIPEPVILDSLLDGLTWESQELGYNQAEGQWETHFDGVAGHMVYFMQVVDGAGNVTLTANKGLFFAPNRHNVYLSVVFREKKKNLRVDPVIGFFPAEEARERWKRC